jgi:light-regulated signal transduction histidine kinase (bacteriophytochrome)
VLTTSEKDLAEQNREHLSEVEAALGRSMVEAADRQERLIRESENLLKEMQLSLVEAAGATVRQQEQLVRQGDVLLKVVDATGQITKLEESLTQNLAAVQQSHSFEDMAVNLSAAIQLLSSRLGHVAKNQAA